MNVSENTQLYRTYGAHPAEEGWSFRVYAPSAREAALAGDFNHWQPVPMERQGSDWVLTVSDARPGDCYKYVITGADGQVRWKADPYGTYAQLRPDTASRLFDVSGFHWHDDVWRERRRETPLTEGPLNIYEVHCGSWQRGEDGEFLNYRRLADRLAPYVRSMGYNAVELLPVTEYPLDDSWGYQCVGYFAPTSRYGDPHDFMYLVDRLHRAGLAGILDWVPAHFCKDSHGLIQFDGSCLYEYSDPLKWEHESWGTRVFDFGKPEVCSFLLSSAAYWLREYHLDGLRVDAVASMLYLDYGKEAGQWVPNQYGDNKNLEAIEFFKHINTLVLGRNPGAVMIAEESTAWPKVTGPVEDDGLNFSYKWNMGWMHDFLDYMKLDPYFRRDNHHKMTFAMSYNESEKYILVLSHDEVVHLKCSMINKMPGLGIDKFRNLMAGYAFMMGHPGKKLLFMGQEFAQLREWSEERELDWFLLDNPDHKHIQNWVKKLLHIYRKNPALYELDSSWGGFEWINANDADRSIYSFIRKSKDGKNQLLFVCSFTPVARPDYRVGVPAKKTYKLILDSDSEEFGGCGRQRPQSYKAVEAECDGRPYSIAYPLEPYGVAVFRY